MIVGELSRGESNVADLALGPVSWERMIRAVEKVRERLLRAAAALEKAGILYAIAGGNAVAPDLDRLGGIQWCIHPVRLPLCGSRICPLAVCRHPIHGGPWPHRRSAVPGFTDRPW
jgi:hypothetical protein